MKTVLDFLGQLWLRFLKPNGPITIPHQTEGKAKRFSDNNSLLQKSLETFLQEIIEFRFNLLSDETEYRYKRSEADRFYPVAQRDLKYHPFRQYMERLPEWDGKDRVSDLARRVSSEPLWVEGFHRWMLALASQWMGSGSSTSMSSTGCPTVKWFC